MLEAENPDPKRTLRIDITGSDPAVGKTTLAAIIADAIDKTFANTLVEIHSQDGDFHYRYNEMHSGDLMKIGAERVVIIDHNAQFQSSDLKDTGRLYTLPKAEAATSDTATPVTEGQRLAEIVRATARDMALPFAQVELLYAAVMKNENWPK